MRFVIINLPPRNLRDQIESLRKPLNDLVEAREALRYPPHLTLRTGIVCPDDKAHEVAAAFLAHAGRLAPVPVHTQGLIFTTYGERASEKGLVAWSVAPDEALLNLHRDLLAFTDWAKGPQTSYHPHVTLAFDDISAAQTKLIQTEVSQQKPPVADFLWVIDHVALYYEVAEGWVEWARVTLSSLPRETSP